MKKKPLGMAADFYRLRLIRLDEGDLPDLEWRTDILYRTLPAQRLEEYDIYVVEAIEIADDERVTRVGSLADAEEARALMDAAQHDLSDLTRNEFEDRYFSAG